MTGGPPGSDRPLDIRQVRLAVESCFPDLAPVRAEPLAEGWDSEAYRVNDEWVFRFPKRQDVGELVDREARVLSLVADAVSVRVPRIERLGSPGPHFPYRFGGYPLIPGVGGDTLPDVLEPQAERRVASALGRALTELHSVDIERAASLGAAEGEFDPARRLTQARDVAPRLAELLPEATYRDYLLLIGGAVAPPAASGLRRFTHNDLGVEHLLFDPATFDLMGLIDFGDLAIDDPAIDFVPLYHWRGEQFVRDVLGHYQLATDAGFLDRVRFDAVVAAGIWLAAAAAYSSRPDVERHQRWFARSIVPALPTLLHAPGS